MKNNKEGTIDIAFFEDIYKTYYPRLAVFASFFLKTEEVHDIIQDVFLNLLETNITDKHSLNAYLHKAVRNKCVDYLRHQDVKNQYSSELGNKLLQKESEYFYATYNEIEEALISKELNEKIQETVAELPPRGKEVFNLYFFQQKTINEIATILNLSKSTIENHIYNNLKIIRQKMSKYLTIILLFLFY